MLSGIKDVDMIILNNLDDVDLVKTCQVNKKADQICNDQSFWFNRIRIKFPQIDVKILRKYKGDRSWSEYYIGDLRNVTKDALLPSSMSGGLDRVMIAVGLGADVNFKNNLPLREASARGYLDVVKYLVSSGADIHADDDDALIWASLNDHLDVVKYLVSVGANIHAQDDEAILHGKPEVVDYLKSQM